MSFDLNYIKEKNSFKNINEFVDFLITKDFAKDFYKDFTKGVVHEKLFRDMDEDEFTYEKCYGDYGKFLTVFSSSQRKIFVYEKGKLKEYDSFESFLHSSLFTMNFRGKLIEEIYSENLLTHYTGNEEIVTKLEEDFFLGSLTMYMLPDNGVCVRTDNKWGFKIFDLYKVVDYQTDRESVEVALELFKKYNSGNERYIIYIAFLEFVLDNFNDKDKLSEYNEFFLEFVNNMKYTKYYIPPIFLEKLKNEEENRQIYIDVLVDKLKRNKLYPIFFGEALKDKDSFYNKRFEDYESDLIFDEEDYLISVDYAVNHFPNLPDTFFRSIDDKILLDMIDVGEGKTLHPLVEELLKNLYDNKKHLLLNLADKMMNKALFLANYLESNKKHSLVNFIVYFDNFSGNRDYFKWFSNFEKLLMKDKMESIIYLQELMNISTDEDINSIEKAVLYYVGKKLLKENLVIDTKKKKVKKHLDNIIARDNLFTEKEVEEIRKTFPKLPQVSINTAALYKELLEETGQIADKEKKAKNKKARKGFFDNLANSINHDPYQLDVVNDGNEAKKKKKKESINYNDYTEYIDLRHRLDKYKKKLAKSEEQSEILRKNLDVTTEQKVEVPNLKPDEEIVFIDEEPKEEIIKEEIEVKEVIKEEVTTSTPPATSQIDEEIAEEEEVVEEANEELVSMESIEEIKVEKIEPLIEETIVEEKLEEEVQVESPVVVEEKVVVKEEVKVEEVKEEPKKTLESELGIDLETLKALKEIVENPNAKAILALKSLLDNPNIESLDSLKGVIGETSEDEHLDVNGKEVETKLVEPEKEEVVEDDGYVLVEEFEFFGNSLIALQKEIEAKVNNINKGEMFVAPKFLQKLYILKDDDVLNFEKGNIRIFLHFNKMVSSKIKIYKKG